MKIEMKITRFVAALCVATALLCPAYGEQLTGSIGGSGGGGGVTPSGTFTIGDLVVGAGTTSIQDAANATAPINSPVALLATRQPSSAPSSICAGGSLAASFNCDLSNLGYGAAMRITGSATLGQPAAPNYQFTPNLSNYYSYFEVAPGAGWNSSLSSNQGRTGATNDYVKINQFGNGDAYGHMVSCFVTGVQVGATNVFANSACTGYAAQSIAGAAGVYLQIYGDGDCNDTSGVVPTSYDVACIGLAMNMTRNATPTGTQTTGSFPVGGLGATWIAVRPQCVGSQPCDGLLSGSGKWNVGFDAVDGNYGANEAAIVFGATQRFYLGATSGTNGLPQNINLGTDYFTAPAAGQFNLVLGGSSKFSYTSPTWTLAGNLSVTGGNILVASGQVLGFRGGSTPLSSPSNAVTHFGSVDAATAVAQTTGVQSIVAGTSNVSGANWTIVGSLSTGTGTNGNIIVQVGGTGAAATVQNTAINAMVIVGGTGVWQYPTAVTGTPTASVCLDAGNNIIKKTTAGSCV